jgi:arsenate reductase
MKMHLSFEDPARFEGREQEKLAKFREVRDLIERNVKEWAAEQQMSVR